MSIDWITVSAQVVNFLVLVWLLKRFLYQPVLDAMDARAQQATEHLEAAQEREQLAETADKTFHDKETKFDCERDALLVEAKADADQQRKDLLRAVHVEVNAAREQWLQQVAQEKDEFLKGLRRQGAEVIQSIARRALTDLAQADLEERVVDTFIAQLKTLESEAREAIAQSSKTFVVSSVFELSAGVRRRLTRALHESIAEREVEYTQDPELLLGISLISGERRVSWNLAHYLDELSSGLDNTLDVNRPIAFADSTSQDDVEGTA